MSEQLEFNPEISPDEQKEQPTTLEDFLEELQEEGINTLSLEEIKKQLELPAIIVTRDFNGGIRISNEGRGKYRTFTTNDLENPEHPLAKKFGTRKIIV